MMVSPITCPTIKPLLFATTEYALVMFCGHTNDMEMGLEYSVANTSAFVIETSTVIQDIALLMLNERKQEEVVAC